MGINGSINWFLLYKNYLIMGFAFMINKNNNE